MDKLFDNFFHPRVQDDNDGFLLSPRVDIKDKEDHFEIIAELPGVKKEDLKVTVHEGMLTIEASRNEEKTVENAGKIIRQERYSGNYQRSFSIGNNIHESDIKARFEDGLLTLTAPKLEVSQPSARQIEVS
jgi:HSP20 family protein